jgi:hypothetical protein
VRSLLPARLFLAGTLIASGGVADAAQLGPHILPAPVGHAQPRAQDFAPGSEANDAEQNRLSTFDPEQHKLDEMLDNKLNICRC